MRQIDTPTNRHYPFIRTNSISRLSKSHDSLSEGNKVQIKMVNLFPIANETPFSICPTVVKDECSTDWARHMHVQFMMNILLQRLNLKDNSLFT